jgi:hypothetical protein
MLSEEAAKMQAEVRQYLSQIDRLSKHQSVFAPACLNHLFPIGLIIPVLYRSESGGKKITLQ